MATKLSATDLVLDVETSNSECLLWLDTVANQRLHDTIKEKPADKLIQECPYLQHLPPQLVPALPQEATGDRPVLEQSLDDMPLHHEPNSADLT